MRVSRKEMERSHERIVDGASRLLRERGIEGSSVADLMGQAGLKHGGFYRHFESKDDLVKAALQAAFSQAVASLESDFEDRGPAEAVAVHQARYLSRGHVENTGIGCPVAALSADVSRSNEDLKATFGAGVNKVLEALAKGLSGSKQERLAGAAREFAMLVGAVSIARASDAETARMILSACRKSPAR